MLHRQQEDLRSTSPVEKLRAIGIPFPLHPAEQFPIGRTEGDQIATAAMIGPENELLRSQFGERALDIRRPQSRAIPPDRDHFVISELRDFLDRVLEALRKIAARLVMNARAGRGGAAGCEKMNINLRRKFRAQFAVVEKRPRRFRKSTPRQVRMYLIGENENSSAHNSWI